MSNYILYIESATDVCSVAVAESGILIKSMETEGAKQHISHLSLLIKDLLDSCRITYKDLSAIGLSRGPGSYTGLRVGYATAKGLCFALRIPLLEVDTLAALAWAIKERACATAGIFVPMLDARRLEVYTAVYDMFLKPLIPVHAHILDEKSMLAWTSNDYQLFVGGSGASKWAELLVGQSESNVIFYSDLACDAANLVELGWKTYLEKGFSDVAYTTPHYLKPPNITKSKKRPLF